MRQQISKKGFQRDQHRGGQLRRLARLCFVMTRWRSLPPIRPRRWKHDCCRALPGIEIAVSRTPRPEPGALAHSLAPGTRVCHRLIWQASKTFEAAVTIKALRRTPSLAEAAGMALLTQVGQPGDMYLA